jgi:transcriptional regulator with XRE-family HTH domain
MTVEKLASSSGISKGLLSKIENGKTLPSLPVFFALIDALGLSTQDFFSRDEQSGRKGITLIKAAVKENGKQDDHSLTLWATTVPKSRITIDVLNFSGDSVKRWLIRSGTELYIVQSGECTCQLDGQTIHAVHGDVFLLEVLSPEAQAEVATAACSLLRLRINTSL